MAHVSDTGCQPPTLTDGPPLPPTLGLPSFFCFFYRVSILRPSLDGVGLALTEFSFSSDCLMSSFLGCLTPLGDPSHSGYRVFFFYRVFNNQWCWFVTGTAFFDGLYFWSNLVSTSCTEPTNQRNNENPSLFEEGLNSITRHAQTENPVKPGKKKKAVSFFFLIPKTNKQTKKQV